MTLFKTICIGGLCFAAGYCVCQNRHQPASSLEQHVVQEKPVSDDTVHTLFHFLRTYEGERILPQEKDTKSPLSPSTLWEKLPSEMKMKLVKEVVTSQAERGYEVVKDQTHSMYEELKHYVQKQIRGEH